MSEIKETEKYYWAMEKDVSSGFNRLKAQIFNLLEATITDEKQCTALKGLVKGFANEAYTTTIANMRYDAKDAGIVDNPHETPITAYPLETAEVN